jgi:hypothetical protein
MYHLILEMLIKLLYRMAGMAAIRRAGRRLVGGGRLAQAPSRPVSTTPAGLGRPDFTQVFLLNTFSFLVLFSLQQQICAVLTPPLHPLLCCRTSNPTAAKRPISWSKCSRIRNCSTTLSASTAVRSMARCACQTWSSCVTSPHKSSLGPAILLGI